MGLIQLPKDTKNFFNKNIHNIFKSGNFAENVWNGKLKNLVNKITGSKGSEIFCSNGAGLFTILQIYKEYYGRKEILIQNNTMYGMYTMAVSSGLKLKGFIDCNLETLMPSFENFISSLKKTKTRNDKLVVMLSHMGGIINPDIIKISNYCKKKNIKLLEDCAHSFGATINKKHSGLFGDSGVYSFYATKAIPAGEGGILVSKDKKLIKLAQRYVKYDRFEQNMSIGINFRVSEMQALLIFSAIKNYKKIIKNKNKIFKIYEKFCKKNNIEFIDQYKKGTGNHYKFTIINKKQKISNYLTKLKTRTSGIYDYSLDGDDYIPNHHVCLPIWYNQKMSITKKVLKELETSLNV